MDAITYTQAIQNFSSVMNKVCDDREPIIITRQSEPSVVVMSLEDYNAIAETIYLIKSPANAQRLHKALKKLRGKEYKKQQLIEE